MISNVPAVMSLRRNICMSVKWEAVSSKTVPDKHIYIFNTWSSSPSKNLGKTFTTYTFQDVWSAHSTVYHFPILFHVSFSIHSHTYLPFHIYCPFLHLSLHLYLGLYKSPFFSFSLNHYQINFFLLLLCFSILLLATVFIVGDPSSLWMWWFITKWAKTPHKTLSTFPLCTPPSHINLFQHWSNSHFNCHFFCVE